jgi:hypothetical protein
MTLETKVQEHSFNEHAAGSRMGMHYFANTAHYHAADLRTWLPKLRSLGAKWVVLPVTPDRNIPEDFIINLLQAGIEPILHVQLSLEKVAKVDDLQTLFEAYANYGVRYVVLFDRPNLRSRWPRSGWTQRGLVARFLDLFKPAAYAAIDAGLTPVFPALEPGGDYWDTAFLRSALEALETDGEDILLDKLALAAYAWAGDKPLTWGEGGPERWPATLPYATPENSQDQRGFHIFDWYNAVSTAAIGRQLPVIILAAGTQAGGKADPARTREIAAAFDKLPANVIAANLWLLAADAGAPEAEQAFFTAAGDANEIAQAWLGETPLAQTAAEPELTVADEQLAYEEPITRAHAIPDIEDAIPSGTRPIRHYLLLPNSSEWSLDRAKDFIAKFQPTIGYSVQEAKHAQRVTLAGGLQSFSDDLIRALIQAGCQVENLNA